MADHLTEEEQVEAIKRWWNENWVSIVLPVILALGGYLGWNLWKDHVAEQAQAASDMYQQLTQAAQTAPGTSLSAEQKAKIGESAEVLISSHGDSLYADLANLLLARIHVEDGQLDAAQTRLEQVAADGANDSMQHIGKARLARVLAAKGDYAKALEMVAQTAHEPFKALFAEVRGDVYVAEGKLAEAGTAYQSALETLQPSEFNRRSLLQLKLDAVAVPAPQGSVEPAAVEGDA